MNIFYLYKEQPFEEQIIKIQFEHNLEEACANKTLEEYISHLLAIYKDLQNSNMNRVAVVYVKKGKVQKKTSISSKFILDTNYKSTVDVFTLNEGDYFSEDCYSEVYQVTQVLYPGCVLAMELDEQGNPIDGSGKEWFTNKDYPCYSPCIVPMVKVDDNSV